MPIAAAIHQLGLKVSALRYDRTRKGWHVIVFLKEALEPAETVLCQFSCGSDSRRETLNSMRVLGMRKHGASKFWRDRFNILYSEKLR